MDWATRRRVIIVSVIAGIGVMLLALTLVATLSKTPSCADGVQNQDEQGVDCGGSCAYLCRTALQTPTTLFTRALRSPLGRTDVLAVVQNKNLMAAAKAVPYTITLYGEDLLPLAERRGVTDLFPAASMEGGKSVVYVPGVYVGNAHVRSAGLVLDAAAAQWYTLAPDPRVVPSVGSFVLTRESTEPRVSVALTNSSVTAQTNVRAVIAVYDAAGNVLTASQTVVTTIPAQGSANALFTWAAPFGAPVARIEVFPVIPLP